MIEISYGRFADLIIAEERSTRLCEILKKRTWTGLSGEEVRLIQEMLGIREEDERK